MRKKGAISVWAEERNKDLYRVYKVLQRKHLCLYGRICKTALLNELVNSPATRYWISPERAYLVITHIRKRGFTFAEGRKISDLYSSLYTDFCTFKLTHPNMSDKRAAEEVVNLPAPCFGVEPKVAGMIVCKMEKQCRREKIERLKRHAR